MLGDYEGDCGLRRPTGTRVAL